MSPPVAIRKNEAGARRVVIGICTYKRPASLDKLLRALESLEPVQDCDLQVAVVDNDADGSAKTVCEEATARGNLPISYFREERRGISHVRNRLLEFALENGQMLAFIDDDEEPEAAWLAALMKLHRETGCAVVIGPVYPRFLPTAPAWAIKSGVYDLKFVPDGERMSDGISGNALLDLTQIGPLGLRFDPRLGLTGGEDQFFFRAVAKAGLHIRFAAGATVWEDVPKSRLELRYVVRRNLRKGTTLSLCDLELAKSPTVIATRFVKGAGRLATGLVASAAAIATGRKAGAVAGLASAAFGAGMLAGLLGMRVREY